MGRDQISKSLRSPAVTGGPKSKNKNYQIAIDQIRFLD
jgi:hypothetical protein